MPLTPNLLTSKTQTIWKSQQSHKTCRANDLLPCSAFRMRIIFQFAFWVFSFSKIIQSHFHSMVILVLFLYCHLFISEVSWLHAFAILTRLNSFTLTVFAFKFNLVHVQYTYSLLFMFYFIYMSIPEYIVLRSVRVCLKHFAYKRKHCRTDPCSLRSTKRLKTKFHSNS